MAQPSVNNKPAHATASAEFPINLFSGYSPSSASLTSPGDSPHAFITWITESLKTSNQFTALWLAVAAVALTLEICAGLMRGLMWCASGNASDVCSAVWRSLFPEKPEVRVPSPVEAFTCTFVCFTICASDCFWCDISGRAVVARTAAYMRHTSINARSLDTECQSLISEDFWVKSCYSSPRFTHAMAI